MYRPIYRASELYSCRKRLVAIRLGLAGEPLPIYLAMAAKEGQLHEEWVKQSYLQCDVWAEQKEVEIKKDDLPFIIQGHIDGETYGKDLQRILLEIKSMSQFEFDRFMKGRWAEFPTYANQVTAYMAATEHTSCRYIVKNRNSGYIDDQMLDKPPADIQKILARVAEVEQWAIEHLKLPYPDIPSQIPPSWESYNPNSYDCKRCPYSKILGCIIEPQIGEIDLAMLEDARNDWVQALELESEASELKDNAKVIFKEMSVRKGLQGQTWAYKDLRILHHEVDKKAYMVEARKYWETRITVVKPKKGAEPNGG